MKQKVCSILKTIFNKKIMTNIKSEPSEPTHLDVRMVAY